MGAFAGDALTDSDNNVAIGYLALTSETTGHGSTAVGYNTLGNQNVAGGSQTQNTAIGYNAGALIASATLNTAVGALALDAEINGHRNTAVGYAALSTQQSGTSTNTSNTAMGFHAGVSITTGGSNTIVGSDAGDSITGGSNNVIVGQNSDCGGTESNTIVLGQSVQAVGSSNFTFGAGSTDSNIAAGATTITAPSDERYKENIADSTAGLSFINDLRPVTFQWKKEKDVPSNHRSYVEGSDKRVMNSDGEINHGFIAQEVKTAIDNHSELKDGFDMWSEENIEGGGGRQRVAPAALIPMLVKAIQELSAEIETLKSGG
jgi:hypothetical protein